MTVQKTVNHVSFKVYNGYAPKDGPRALRVSIDFSVFNPYPFDLSIAQETDQIEWVQAIYCDNSANPNPFSLTMGVSRQTLTWPAYNQGYLPCLCPNAPRFSASSPGYTGSVNIQLLNFPVPAMLWGANANGAGGSFNIAPFASTDGSTTITAGATAQNLFTGVTPLNGYGIYNPSATADLWVSDSTTAAANAAGSIRVAANGGYYETALDYKPLGVVSIYGGTTGQPITARRW